MKIAVLADNTVVARNAKGEHGLAFWIERGRNRVLFDTGQGLVLASNAQALSFDLDAVDTIVLSHGHYDHTGGMAEVLPQSGRQVTIHVHPDALLPKYSKGDQGIRDIGIPPRAREAMLGGRCQFVASRQSVEIAPGIRTTGEIPRRHAEETVTTPFYRDPLATGPDPLLDDQALFIETTEGTVVLLGCAHSGVINTLDHVRELARGRPLCAAIGGMHLRAASDARIAWTMLELRRFGLNTLVPMHCTGEKAIAALWNAFPAACRPGGVGTVFNF